MPGLVNIISIIILVYTITWLLCAFSLVVARDLLDHFSHPHSTSSWGVLFVLYTMWRRRMWSITVHKHGKMSSGQKTWFTQIKILHPTNYSGYKTNYCRSSNKANIKFVIPKCKTTTYQKSFFTRSTRTWNILADELNLTMDSHAITSHLWKLPLTVRTLVHLKPSV